MSYNAQKGDGHESCGFRVKPKLAGVPLERLEGTSLIGASGEMASAGTVDGEPLVRVYQPAALP